MRHVCPNDRSRAIMLEQLNMSQTGRTESDNQGSVSFVNSHSFDCSEATRSRFSQAASSKSTSSGILIIAPLSTFSSGTRKNSASPHGSKFVLLKKSHIV